MLKARVAVALGLISLAACGTTTSIHLTTGPSPSPSAAPTNHLDVVATDADFVPDPMWVKSGHVTFTITNQGSAAHAFKITDQDGDPIVKSDAAIPPGGKITLEVPFLAVGYYIVTDVLSSHVAPTYKVDLVAV